MKLSSLSLSDRMLDLVARRFRLLGEPQRLRILQALEAGERSVSEVSESTGASQPNISKHLSSLFDGGIISRRKEGNTVLYAIADTLVFKICDLVCRSAADQAQAQASEIAKERATFRRR